MFSLIYAWTDWINGPDTSDLRRHRAHYDVIVMTMIWSKQSKDKPCPWNKIYSNNKLWNTVIDIKNLITESQYNEIYSKLLGTLFQDNVQFLIIIVII